MRIAGSRSSSLPDGVLMLSGGAHVAYTPEGLWKGSLSAMTQNVTDAILTMPFIDSSSFSKPTRRGSRPSRPI
jgi:hypothetical protein